MITGSESSVASQPKPVTGLHSLILSHGDITHFLLNPKWSINPIKHRVVQPDCVIQVRKWKISNS